MKIWYGYGSEHSMNLVMIGHFKEVSDAVETMQLIERIKDQVRSDVQDKLIHIGMPTDRFPDEMLDLLCKLKVHTVGPVELEQFVYEYNIEIKGNDLVLTTDESDVSAFMKLLIDRGARVEVYSAHSHPDTGYGRRNLEASE